MSDGILRENANTLVPQVGGVYRHWKGGLYVVLGVARDSGPNYLDNSYRKVHYMSLEDGQHYHRPMWDKEEGFCNPKIHEDNTSEEKFKFMGYAQVSINRRGKYLVVREY